MFSLPTYLHIHTPKMKQAGCLVEQVDHFFTRNTNPMKYKYAPINIATYCCLI